VSSYASPGDFTAARQSVVSDELWMMLVSVIRGDTRRSSSHRSGSSTTTDRSPGRPQGRRGVASTEPSTEPTPRTRRPAPSPRAAERSPTPPRSATPQTGPSFGGGPEPDPGSPTPEVWELVEHAQNGDAEAFGALYDRYLDTVFRYVYFRVGNRTLAEDLTQEVFLRALKRIGSLTYQGRDLGAWLVTIARNLVADHFKSGRHRLEVATADVLDTDREERGPEGSPETAVVEKITNTTLLEAVTRLNPEQRECIMLRFLHGFSVAETARAMGKNEGAIKALQYRAVRALARLLPEGFTL